MPEPVAWTLVRRGLADPRRGARVPGRPTGRWPRPRTSPGIGEAADRLARAVRAAASASPCTATTTATASAPRRSWCGPCAGAAAQVERLPAEPLHRGLRRRRGDGRAPRGRRGAAARLRRLRHLGGRGADPGRRPRDGRRSCSTTTSPAGAGPRASSPTRPSAGPTTTCRPRSAWCTWLVRALAARIDGGAPGPGPRRGHRPGRARHGRRRRAADRRQPAPRGPGPARHARAAAARHRRPLRRGRDRAAAS